MNFADLLPPEFLKELEAAMQEIVPKDLQEKGWRYLDDHAETFVLLDQPDYWWAVRWRWHAHKAGGGSKKSKKRYPCRSQSNGRRYAPKLYLHVEIMRRTGILPPTPEHTMVDHRDGNEFNCLRSNLRWATPSMNRLNLFGSRSDDFFDLAEPQNCLETAA